MKTTDKNFIGFINNIKESWATNPIPKDEAFTLLNHYVKLRKFIESSERVKNTGGIIIND